MKHAHITLSVPLPDDATQEDAEVLAQLIKQNTVVAVTEVVRTELVEGNKLGTAGARELLDKIDKGEL